MAQTINNHPQIEPLVEKLTDYLYQHAKNIDKATLLKYVGIAILVIYGLRKSNLLSGIAITLISGLVANLISSGGESSTQHNDDVIASLIKKLV